MKINLILSLLSLCLSWSAIAQTEKKVPTKITEVTVYQQGAELTHEATPYVNKGNTTLIFEGLSAHLDPESLQVKAPEGLMMVSISHQLDYLQKTQASEAIDDLETQQRDTQDRIALLDAFQKVYQQEKAMILANKAIGGSQGVPISELRNAASFFRSKLSEIEVEIQKNTQQQFALRKKLVEISNQLSVLNIKSNQPTSQVKVVVTTEVAQSYPLTLKYIVDEAGWEPNYDLRITEVDQPLGLFYKAKVYQNTNEDWKDVKLTLSTGNPNVSNQKPDLSPYYLNFDNVYRRRNQVTKAQSTFHGKLSGRVTDLETGDPLVAAEVLVVGTQQHVFTDFNGYYEIRVPSGKNRLLFQYGSFQSQELYITNAHQDVALSLHQNTFSKEMSPQADVASALMGRTVGVPIRESKKAHIPLAIEKRQTSTEFEIELPYTIPSDNKDYDVTMVEYQVPATYHYTAVPKLSKDAYLTAKIADWTQYQMVSGKANLFLQGTYQGETYLDTEAFEDSLSVSVGRDKDILVSRKLQQDFSKKTTIGGAKKVLKSWEIIVKNTKNTPVTLVLEDQYPVAHVDAIKVEQIETSGAKIDPHTGSLTWELRLQPNEKKVLLVKYAVKYPKNKALQVD